MAPMAMAMPLRLMMFEVTPQVVHADEGDDDRDRQGQDHHEGARQVEKEDDADDAYGDRELDDLLGERVDRPVDQVGTGRRW